MGIGPDGGSPCWAIGAIVLPQIESKGKQTVEFSLKTTYWATAQSVFYGVISYWRACSDLTTSRTETSPTCGLPICDVYRCLRVLTAVDRSEDWEFELNPAARRKGQRQWPFFFARAKLCLSNQQGGPQPLPSPPAGLSPWQSQQFLSICLQKLLHGLFSIQRWSL